MTPLRVRLFIISGFWLLIVVSLHQTFGQPTSGEVKPGYAMKIFKKLKKSPGFVLDIFDYWEKFVIIRDYFDRTRAPTAEEYLDLINQKIDQLASDVLAFEKRINVELETTQNVQELKKALDDFFLSVDWIDERYTEFSKLTNKSLTFLEKDMANLVELTKEVDSTLNEMHKAFGTRKPKLKPSIPALLDISNIGQQYMCHLNQSTQQSINILYQLMLLTEVKGYNLLMYANEYNIGLQNEIHNTSNKQAALNSFYSRMAATFETVKLSMEVVSREIWNCDSRNPIEGWHYARVAPVLQASILYQHRATNYKGKHYGCLLGCDDFGYSNEESSTEYQRLDYCDRHLHCKFHGKGVTYCTANDGYRGYEYIKFKDNGTYGNDYDCMSGDIFTGERKHEKIGRDLWHECDYCLCTCERDRIDRDRFFSLRPVFSDYNDNKVITGARLKLFNNMFYIQIKQGTLLPNGRIESSDWQPVNNHSINSHYEEGKDYFKVSWDSRGVLLDELDSSLGNYENDFVLTGLQLRNADHKFQLYVYVSRFNTTTGVLDNKNEPKVYTNESKKRIELSMYNLDLPTKYLNNEKRNKQNEYLIFDISGLVQDAGQTMLPYIDIQPIETNPPSPISGAGLFLRADKQGLSGGYLSLKLFTMDNLPYLKNPQLDANEK